MPTLKVKNKKYDDTNMSELVDELGLEEYALKMHRRLVKATKLTKAEGKIDQHALKTLLAEFPAMYSWAIVESRLIKNKYEEKKDEFDDQMKLWYDEMCKEMEKATQKAIDAAIYSENKKEIDRTKKNIKDLESKQKLAQDLVTVWSSTIHSLQSLSKHIHLEYELSKMGHKK